MRNPAVAVIAVSSLALSLVEGLWLRSRPFAELVGKPVALTGQSLIFLGIAPPGFNGLERLNSAEVWYPVEIRRDGSGRVCRLLRFLSATQNAGPSNIRFRSDECRR